MLNLLFVVSVIYKKLIDMENLRALVYGIQLTIYQKALAKEEFKKLEKELAEKDTLIDKLNKKLNDWTNQDLEQVSPDR